MREAVLARRLLTPKPLFYKNNARRALQRCFVSCPHHRYYTTTAAAAAATTTTTTAPPPTMANAPVPSKPLKILMLHGYTQSGPLFRSKTRALEKNLAKAFPAGVTLSYPTAPLRLSPAQIPGWDTDGVSKADLKPDDELPDAWGWWVRKGDTVPFVYDGLEAGFESIADVCKAEGPFDGVIGFSQGAAAAGMIVSLLEPGRKEAFDAKQKHGGMPYPDALLKSGHPPFKFAASYSGFAPSDTELYTAFYEPKIQTPMLHVLGSLDTVVEESRSLRLANACAKSEGRVIYHPGGHFLPSSQKQYVAALVGFIREVMAEAEGNVKKEESVEDMDVPF